MKRNDISAKFSTHLTDALAEGFSPCMTELRGSYSGVLGTQLVLAKGNERMVMWMEEDCIYTNPSEPVAVRLFVSRFALGKGESCEFTYNWPNDWKEHLVDEMVVYEVSDRRDGWYVEDHKVAIRAKATHRSRYRTVSSGSGYREYDVDDRILAIARKMKGFKTVKPENLRVFKAYGTWHFVNKRSQRSVELH